MTSTFDIVTCFLFVVHCLVMMIICVNISKNPIMYDKLLGRYEQVSLWPWPLTKWHVFMCNTSSWHVDHVCQISLYPIMQDKVMESGTGFTEGYAQSLRVNCDLDLWPSNMVLVRDTSSYLCQVIFKSHHAGQSYGLDTILEHTNEQTHTNRVNSKCRSTMSWWGHKNGFILQQQKSTSIL